MEVSTSNLLCIIPIFYHLELALKKLNICVCCNVRFACLFAYKVPTFLLK